MKKYVFLLFIFGVRCFSQSSSDREIFDSIFKETETSVFVVSKQSYGDKVLEKIVSKKCIYNRNFREKNITLSEGEVSYLLDEIKKNKSYNFSKRDFPKALLISNDTVQSYSSNKSKKYLKEAHAVFETKDSIKIRKFRSERPYQFRETIVHFFSKPIYFRNDTFCILYHAELCCFHNGVDGYPSVYIFQKVNNTWERYFCISPGPY